MFKEGMDIEGILAGVNGSYSANVTRSDGGADMFGSMLTSSHALDETPGLKWFFVTCLIIQSIFGTIGNLLVIGAVFVMDALNHTGNAFIVNLAVADLCVTAFAQPANVLGALYGEEYFTSRPIYCSLVSTLCATGCLASCWNLAMIALNRYILICQWEYYEAIYTKRNTTILCLSVWLIIYLIELPNHVGWGDLRFSDLFFLCTFANHVHSYALFYVLVGIFIPLSVSFICYLRIYLKVKDSKLTRNRILYAKNESREANDGGVTAEDQLSGTRNPSSSRKFYEDLKIIQVLFRVQIIYVAMWLPLVLLILFHLAQEISYVWYILVLLCAHGNSAINCMIYAATIEHFREGYKKLLGLHKRSGGVHRGSPKNGGKTKRISLRGKRSLLVSGSDPENLLTPSSESANPLSRQSVTASTTLTNIASSALTDRSASSSAVLLLQR